MHAARGCAFSFTARRPTGLNRQGGPGLFSCRAAQRADIQRSLQLLQLQSIDSLTELREAYYERIREAHPDSNLGADTTHEASQINAAYATLREALVTPGAQILGSGSSGDVFDTPGPLTSWFANPFALGCEPLQWRELQAAFAECFERGLNTDAALLELRLRNPYSAAAPVAWLTQPQLQEVQVMMEECERTLSYDTAAWFLEDALLRASNAAKRAPQT